MNKDLLNNPDVKEIALKFANSFRVTELCENMWDEFVKAQEPVKEWEIVSFNKIINGSASDGYIFYKGDETNFIHPNLWGGTQEQMLEGGATIHSVKRLKDNTTFTIGDIVATATGEKIKIYKFRLAETGQIYINDNFLLWGYNHAKRKHLFTTVDGMDICDGDTFYFIVDWKIRDHVAQPYHKEAHNIRQMTFSTQAAAEDYVLLNKPVLSVQKLLDTNAIVWGGPQTDQILKLAKSLL